MPKTVKVRIAVAVDENGEWSSCGDSEVTDVLAMQDATECFGPSEVFRRYFVEAELELPEFQTVQGTITNT